MHADVADCVIVSVYVGEENLVVFCLDLNHAVRFNVSCRSYLGISNLRNYRLLPNLFNKQKITRKILA